MTGVKWSSKTPNLPIEYLKERLKYNPDTGEFIWIKSLKAPLNGKVAGSIDTNGYMRIMLNKTYYLHILAYAFMNNEWPPNSVEIDHKNHIRSDNRWENLRLCDKGAKNAWNRSNGKIKQASKYKGVLNCPSSTNLKWRGMITVNGVQHRLGTYATEEEAALAYNEAAIKYFGEFAVLNDLSDVNNVGVLLNKYNKSTKHYGNKYFWCDGFAPLSLILEETGNKVNRHTAHRRLKDGWDIESAVLVPTSEEYERSEPMTYREVVEMMEKHNCKLNPATVYTRITRHGWDYNLAMTKKISERHKKARMGTKNETI